MKSTMRSRMSGLFSRGKWHSPKSGVELVTTPRTNISKLGFNKRKSK
eukprot:CAMPEP_0194060072 /NCGR_PEP_ID=MMETSP0009_2-20130614/70788_1 /TAXON_ID=210454 /ORGANISM="Grammatophora oceanica, Strain CCMP 410" /LENGTH=46 /DNA_ID= /DNA_START= /DNA_END= /DNA_ORIENTATION=